MDCYGIIGNPVAHSLSPFIHNTFALQTQQSLRYTPILVGKNNLAEALKKFQAADGRGLNITAPFKEETAMLVDRLTERAQMARAVNTVLFLEDGTSLGDNTDGVGFSRDVIYNQKIHLKNKKVLILGAGGAARGIIPFILQEKPASVSLLNRTQDKAIRLAAEFATLGSINVISLQEMEGQAYDIIIRAASKHDLSLPLKTLSSKSTCYDLNYGDYHQDFERWGSQQGATIVDGLGMLVEQAAESYYLWRKIRPLTAPVLALLRHK